QLSIPLHEAQLGRLRRRCTRHIFRNMSAADRFWDKRYCCHQKQAEAKEAREFSLHDFLLAARTECLSRRKRSHWLFLLVIRKMQETRGSTAITKSAGTKSFRSEVKTSKHKS